MVRADLSEDTGLTTITAASLLAEAGASDVDAGDQLSIVNFVGTARDANGHDITDEIPDGAATVNFNPDGSLLNIVVSPGNVQLPGPR